DFQGVQVITGRGGNGTRGVSVPDRGCSSLLFTEGPPMTLRLGQRREGLTPVERLVGVASISLLLGPPLPPPPTGPEAPPPPGRRAQTQSSSSPWPAITFTTPGRCSPRHRASCPPPPTS